MKAISNDCDVQFYWTLISQDIDEECDAIELLLDIADMWITIRGFSLASSWPEAYKKMKNTKVSRTPGLQKSLYRMSHPPSHKEHDEENTEKEQ